MKTTNSNTRSIVLAGLILFAAFSRLIPHLPNFTPLISIALFGGAYFSNKKWAFAVPLLAMILSDVLLSITQNYALFDNMRIVVYGSFLLITCIGFLLSKRTSLSNITVASLSGSVLFFIITNLAVWYGNALYTQNIAGLTECYAVGIPFFSNMLISTLIYSTALFGGFEFAKYKFPVLANK